jgi:SAM-dependent methyltransferase
MNQELEWTGERLVTSLPPMYGVIEHLHRYALAQQWVRGKKVLDIACGEGYGSYLLAQVAKDVTGVDIDIETVDHAKRKYKDRLPNLQFLVGSATALSEDFENYDVVVSFETLEHVEAQDQMISGLRKVLKPDGLLIISTPDKHTYGKRDPNNPFHVKELQLDELNHLLSSHFAYTRILGQKFIFGSLIEPFEEKTSISGIPVYAGDYYYISEKTKEDPLFNKVFFHVAICSNVPFTSEGIIHSVFDASHLYRKEQSEFKEKIKKMGNIKSRTRSSFWARVVRKIKRLYI